MRGKIGDKIRLQHIFEAIIEIEFYLGEVDYLSFSNNSMMRFATIKQIEIIGEAANHLSEQTKEKYNQVEWRQIVGLRNILVHEYFGVDAYVIWEIVKNDFPDFKKAVSLMLEEIPQ